MKRKNFISSIIPLAATFSEVAKGKTIIEPDNPTFKPPYLKQGDRIGISCPAGFISIADIQPALIKIQDWGFDSWVC